MSSTEIFKESPFIKPLKITGGILGGTLLLFAVSSGIGSIIDKKPLVTAAGLNKSVFILVWVTAICIFFLLITFLLISLQYQKTIKCDFDGFEISETNFWKTSEDSEQFKWNEVKDTNIVETHRVQNRTGFTIVYAFVAETGIGQVDLLNLNTSTKRNIEGLIKYVNEATPHLKYFWIKDENVENRPVSYSVYGFSRVPRNS